MQKYYKEKPSVMGIKVTAIAPDVGDFNIAKKGLVYDPCLESFVIGAHGNISDLETEKDTSTPMVIRGLGSTSQRALKLCADTNRDFYSIDTGYLQPLNTKVKMYHRITKGALQNLGPIIDRNTDRLSSLQWRYREPGSGNTILVCPPSEKVMKFYNKNLDKWMEETIAKIKTQTDRPIEIRLKPDRHERITTNTIWSALDNAYCLITFNSIAATEALLYSVPAIALAPNAASVLCHTSIDDINSATVPSKDTLTAFAAHLSYCQFTNFEMKNGYAWNILNEGS